MWTTGRYAWIFVDLCGSLWIFVDIASSLIYMLVGLTPVTSANYSSEDLEVIAEMLQIAADVCHEETATMLERTSVHALTVDESTCTASAILQSDGISWRGC